MFLRESAYRYVGSVALKAEYRGRKIGTRLLDAFIARHGDRKACLMAVSREGRHLAEHGFSLVRELPGGVCVFASEA